VLGREYSFGDDVFVGSKKDKGPRNTRRERQSMHVTVFSTLILPRRS